MLSTSCRRPSEANAKTIFSLSEKWDDSDDDNEMEKVEILADKKCTTPSRRCTSATCSS